MAGDESSPGDATEPTDVSGSTVLTLDTVFELLANCRRRYVIYSLLEPSSGVLALDDLVDDVTRLESVDGTDSMSEDLRERVASDLHYWHLPVLEDVGVVTYDDRSDVVQFHGNRELERWAARVRDEELPDDR